MTCLVKEMLLTPRRILFLPVVLLLCVAVFGQDKAVSTLTYSGILPCADCRGVSTVITIDRTKRTFRMEERFLGRDESVLRTDGRLRFDRNGNCVLFVEGEIKGRYRMTSRTLTMLDRERHGMTDQPAAGYVLRRTKVMTSNAAWSRKKAAGVDFIAFGNEPFWSLEIDVEKNIRFSTPEMERPVIVPLAGYELKDGSTEYHVGTGSTRFDIAVREQYCSDGMSDNLYEYEVSLSYNDKAYRGCGAMLRVH